MIDPSFLAHSFSIVFCLIHWLWALTERIENEGKVRISQDYSLL